MHVQGSFIEQRVVFKAGECWIIGPDAQFSNCEVIVKARSQNCIMNGAEFLDCTIISNNNLQWDCTKARLKRCAFRGSFLGCDFGYRPPPSGDSDFGAIADCDFSEATLHGCQFFGCDLQTIKLPSWPCFTILDPRNAFEAIKGKPLPGNLHLLFMVTVPGELACCDYAPRVAQECDVTEDEVRRFVEANQHVILA